jgi:hypothetical protein
MYEQTFALPFALGIPGSWQGCVPAMTLKSVDQHSVLGGPILEVAMSVVLNIAITIITANTAMYVSALLKRMILQRCSGEPIYARPARWCGTRMRGGIPDLFRREVVTREIYLLIYALHLQMRSVAYYAW